MTQALITIRRAMPGDADQIAAVHDDAWREAYRGVIPGEELERLIARRGPDWWRRAVRRAAVCWCFRCTGGSAAMSPTDATAPLDRISTARSSSFILRPNIRALGLGRRLFRAGREDLAANGLDTHADLDARDNQSAIDFYRRLGGKEMRRASEHFAGLKAGPRRLSVSTPTAKLCAAPCVGKFQLRFGEPNGY